MLDIFADDAFSLVTLTDNINQIRYVPGRIGQLGLFTPKPVTTTSIAIEQKKGQLILVPPTPRGAPGTTTQKSRRSGLSVAVPHFEINDAIMADEVQGVRAWGSETELETVVGLVAERLGEHSNSFVATEEYARIGAVKGLITYADGSTLNLFTTFGVTQRAVVDFDLDNASPAPGALEKVCTDVCRQIADELGGLPFSGIYALVGDKFWDDLVQHPEVRALYLAQVAAGAPVRGGMAYQTFTYGGITFENYRGAVDDTKFVGDNDAHFYPAGVPGLFNSYQAPADYVETVNTLGKRLYVKQFLMPNAKGVNLDVQMNQLNLCTRPRCLIKGKRT